MMPSSTPYSPTSTCRRIQLRRQYGSVKYSRLPPSTAKEKFFAAKPLVHQTQSSPLSSAPSRKAYGSTNLVYGVGGGSIMSNSSANDRKISVSSNGSRIFGGGHENYLLERKLLSPNTSGKLPITINAAGTTSLANNNRIVGDRQKQKLMALAPPSLHISFDAAENEHQRSNEHHRLMPISLSSDNFRSYRHSIAIPPRNPSPSPLRRDIQRQKQRILEQKEIAEISSEFMRINGVIQQFKGIMADPMKTPAFYSRVATESIDTEGPGQNEFNNNNGARQDGVVRSPQTPSRHMSTETNNKNPSIGRGESQLDDSFNLKLQVSHRLRRRNELFDLRKKMADYSFAVAILGIVLMIVENELTNETASNQHKSSAYSYILKSLIVLFTLVLLALIISYHAVEIKLFMSDNSCEDWRIAVNRRRCITLSLELLVCSICPIPGEFYFTWTTVHSNGSTVTTSQVPVDVLLSIPMFLRCYLVCRVMLLHSRLLTDASSRSIGALNRINFTARFVLKTLMTLSPGTVLLVFTASFWLIMAWIMRLCERWHVGDTSNVEARKFQNYLNSLWLIAITSLTIGYGDITPNTYCGRAVSVICGIMGAGTSSLVVAVVARKLELSRAEKHVHTFMMDSQLSKRLKNAAANVLRETWFIYKYRRLMDKVDSAKIRFHQRKFLVAIYAMRKVKRDQRKLAENSVTVSDMAKTTTAMHEIMSDTQVWQDAVEEKITTLQSHCINLEHQILQINSSIQKLPDLISLKLLQEIAEQSAQNSLRAPSLLSLNNT